MFKNTLFFAAGLCMNCASLFAYMPNQMSTDKTDRAKEDAYCGGAVIGGGVTVHDGRATGLFQVGYYNTHLMFDLGASYSNISRFHGTTLLGHFGPRVRICDPNLFTSFGVVGLGIVGPGNRDRWGAGVFAGLDYQLSRHFLLTGKVYPYSYDHLLEIGRNTVFAGGTISLFYVF